jgi:hypothetical protein
MTVHPGLRKIFSHQTIIDHSVTLFDISAIDLISRLPPEEKATIFRDVLQLLL